MKARAAIALGALSTLLTAAAARAEKTPIAFPQGSEQPLAALQDIDVIEHLGDRVAGDSRTRTAPETRCTSVRS